MALSIIAYSLLPSAARCRKTRSHTPALAQRLNRRCVFFQSPKTSGRSRLVPVQHRLDKATIVTGGGTDVAQLAGNQVLNPFPPVVAKFIAGHAPAFYKADSA